MLKSKPKKTAKTFGEKVVAKYSEIFKCDRDRNESDCTETAEELLKLVNNGDDGACARYILSRLREDALDAADLKYLDGALDNLNCECAVLGCLLYGEKNSAYYDEEKAYYCCVIAEQYGYANAHNILKKNYAKHSDIIDGFDGIVLSRSLQIWAMRLTDRYSAFNAEVVPAEDSAVLDHKNAYSVTVRLEQPNGKQTDKESVYVAFVRGKDSAKYFERLTEGLVETFQIIAEKRNIDSGEIYVKGARKFRYGDAKPMRKVKADTIDVVSDETIDIKVSTSGLLSRETCSECGGALDKNGVCVACGKARVKDIADRIEIRRAKDMEALLCTQCGSRVKLDGNGRTGYCVSCGTTFAVNGNALDYRISGINYASLRADMPNGCELPVVKFVRARIAGDKIAAIMPDNFEVMPDEMRRVKYPVNAPRYIYTTPDSTVNLNVNFAGLLKEDDVFVFGKQMLVALKNTFLTAKFGEAKLIKQSRNIFFIDFITAAVDQQIYNAMFFFSLGGKQGIGSWNCLGKDRWFWAPVFEHAVKTMEFDD